MNVPEIIQGLQTSDMFNVRVFKEGDSYCALHGADLQEGIAGFGRTPQDALRTLASNLEIDHWSDCKTFNECLTTKDVQGDSVILEERHCYECGEYIRG